MVYLLQDIISRRIFARKSTSHNITNYDNGSGFRPTLQGSKYKASKKTTFGYKSPHLPQSTGRNVCCSTSRIILYNASLGLFLAREK